MDSTEHQDLLRRVESLERRMDERDARVDGPMTIKELVKELKARKVRVSEGYIYKRLEKDVAFAAAVAVHSPGRRPCWKIRIDDFLKQMA